MDLQSARELKSRLLADVRTAASDTMGDVPVPRGFAVGLAPRPDGGYAVAIRLREAAAADSLDRIAEQSEDDLDVRTIGIVRPLGDPVDTVDTVEPGDPVDPVEPPPDVSDLQSRQRPLYPGVSIGHPEVSAGTLGGFVVLEDTLHMLSNSHVLANSGQAAEGDAALQPGTADGGADPADRAGTLVRSIPLNPAEPNLVDAAIASVDDGVEADPSRYPGGPVRSVTADPPDDELVEKVGRTTGLTAGRVTAFEVDGLEIQYDVGVLTFDNQIEIEGAGGDPFSQGGDSGSVIWTTSNRQALGLLFAGSTAGGANGRGLTYANPLSVVLAELDATWAGGYDADGGVPPDEPAAR